MQHILILDDDAADALVIAHQLRQHGLRAQCEQAETPAQAAQALGRQTWDAVLLGFQTPGLPFHQTLVNLRTHHPDLPVILLAGNIGEETVADLLREGVWDVVRRDNPLRLASAIERAQRETGLRRAGIQAEERLRLQGAALESAANSIVITDHLGVIEWINPAFTRLTGYTWDEAIGHTHGELVRSDVHPAAFYANLWRTILAGQVWHGEIVNRRKDGILFHEEATITPVADAEGVIRHFVAVKQDISARQEAADALRRDYEQQAALARNEALTRSVMDSLRSAIAVLDRNGTIIRVNQSWRAFAADNGADARTADGVGLNYLDSATPMQADASVVGALQGIRDVLSGVRPNFLLEYPCHSPDQQRWFAMSVTPLQGEGGGGVVVSHIDITQRKLAEIALSNQQQHLEALVATRTTALRESEADLAHAQAIARLGSWRLDLRDNLMTWSDETYRIFGVDLGAPVNFGHFASGAHPDDIEQVLSAWSAALAGAPYDIEHRIVVHGQTRWVRERAELRFDTLGIAVAGLGAIQDITELKQAELAARAALEEAQRLARVKSEFLANMSHEIRTPLNAVLGLAQVGVRDNAHRRAQETFRRILDSGQHLLGVVNDVLDFSKIEAGKLVLEHTPYNLGEAIDRAVNFTAVRAYAKGLGFRVDEAPGLPVMVEGDDMRLTQILLNLLGNAVKFTDAGSVTLAVARDGNALLFRVSDTGIGMTPEQRGRLFTPFEQADASITRRFGGSGLGLTISARLIWAMGGEIRVESEAGRGSRFEVRLPAPELSPAPFAECLRIRLAGLEPDEASPLAAALTRRGILVETVARQEALAAPLPDRVVLADAGQPPPANLGEAAFPLPGARLLVLATPGATRHPGWGDDTHYIDRPVRVRHLLCLPQADTLAQDARAPARLQGWRILAAEDAEVNRIVLEDILIQEGAQVTFAENGAQAVERLETDGPDAFDAVLMDIQMPVMDGYEATRRLHALAPALPVIGLSAHALAEERERSLACGMVEHVTKPIDIDALVAALLRHGRRADAAPRTAPEKLLDEAALNERYGGRVAFIAKLLGSVRTAQQDSAEALRRVAQEGDFAALAFLAHQIKGVAGNLMIPSLQELAARTEAAARAGEAQSADLALRLADRLEALLREIAERPEAAARGG